MAAATNKPKESIAAKLHSSDPILTKQTDLFGEIKVYPPNAPVDQWPLLSFHFKSEHGIDTPKGLNLYIKAKYVSTAFERPHFIADHMLFGHPDLD
jgi:hypothetical protein